MKRILAIPLCLLLIFSVTACKPDNIKYPVEITDPDTQEQPETPEETPAPEQQPEEEETPQETPEQVGEGTDTPEAEQTPTEQEPLPETPVAPTNPLAAEDFKPSTTVDNTLTTSGIVKQGAAVSALKNRTIVLYTANDQPAFTYTDENGKTVTEWSWMEQLATKEGFILKYSVKSAAVSLKSQRVALLAGKKLSLIQTSVGELASALTLTRSSAEYLDLNATTYGISKAVLTQSNSRLFAPVGNINALWYNTALMPENTDPNTLGKTNQWTVETFKAACNNATTLKAMPLIMEETLAWATLSGRSPLTLLEGKLDNNINAQATLDVWSALKTFNSELTPFEKEEGTGYTLKAGNVAFSYTAIPDAEEKVTLRYAPLPALNAETAGTATFNGTFLALPRYETSAESIQAALTFAELWCNRYTETRAAKLLALGVSGTDYTDYCTMAETNGMLILHDTAIEKTVETYLSGLSDPAVNMDEAYASVKNRVNALVAIRNLYY